MARMARMDTIKLTCTYSYASGAEYELIIQNGI